jgi:asparagine synthase (glutamine-hydrolysing)
MSSNEDLPASAIDMMTDSLRHRGPDDRGTVVLDQGHIALGMRRLSIVDVAGGHQPMSDAADQLHLVFNGEIYNHMALRKELRDLGHIFKSDHSDTEVLLHGYEEWRESIFARLNGMFAIALWDDRRRQLVLARDRFGKKPLYVARTKSGYAIASEMKAFLAVDAVDRSVDPISLGQYLAFDFVVAPRTMLTKVSKIPSGHWARVTPEGLDLTAYWSPHLEQDHNLSESAAIQRLDTLLDASTARRLHADVPVGLFLSGGLDSTTIGYYAMRHASAVKSFSIGFEESAWDESSYAARAAKALGTEHYSANLSENDAVGMLQQLPTVLDEPMGDQSVLPMYLLSQLAAQHVKVALGGDGSDEILMGYRSFRLLLANGRLDSLPNSLRGAISSLASGLLAHADGRISQAILKAGSRISLTPTERLLSHLGSFHGNGSAALSSEMQSACGNVLTPAARQMVQGTRLNSGSEELTLAYIRGYLTEDILVKVDRASMAASLEVRTPFLDPELVDFALSLPTSSKLRGCSGKHILRQLMADRLPKETLERPKMGFGVPVDKWLRTSLYDYAHQSLLSDHATAESFFERKEMMRLLAEHRAGAKNHGRQLWVLLQFELWRRRWGIAPALQA